MTVHTLQSLKTDLRDSFGRAGLDTPALDARFIIMSVAGVSQADMIARPDQRLPGDVVAEIRKLKSRRLAGEPLDSVLGFSEFYGRPFKISKHVLSPRPETEHSIDTALHYLKSTESPRVLDLGTGSGAILVTLMAELERGTGVGVDISPDALRIARTNAETHKVGHRTTWLEGSWFEPVTGRFDLIVSNPPYITDKAMHDLPAEVTDYDPDMALRGGADGLTAYRAIAGNAPRYLTCGASLIFEIGFDQGEAVKTLMDGAGFANVSIQKDLSGHDRIVSGLLL